MFYGGISGPQAAVLSIAKLAATTAVYAWGGAGGIFSPTLFLVQRSVLLSPTYVDLGCT